MGAPNPEKHQEPSQSTAATPPRLALAGITKQYPGVLANDDVALKVQPGEIHAVLGENGRHCVSRMRRRLLSKQSGIQSPRLGAAGR